MQSEKYHLLLLIYKIKQMTYEGMVSLLRGTFIFCFLINFVVMQKVPDDGNG